MFTLRPLVELIFTLVWNLCRIFSLSRFKNPYGNFTFLTLILGRPSTKGPWSIWPPPGRRCEPERWTTGRGSRPDINKRIYSNFTWETVVLTRTKRRVNVLLSLNSEAALKTLEKERRAARPWRETGTRNSKEVWGGEGNSFFLTCKKENERNSRALLVGLDRYAKRVDYKPNIFTASLY